MELHPLIEAYASGMLDVGDGNSIYWEIAGNPRGVPAVVLHGGPGQGSSPGMRRGCDPNSYRVVLFDQRGCGKSRPHASAASTDMSLNTTAHLVSDVEKLRAHLGIEKWVVCGGSWGVTLALAYAEKHVDRVLALVLQDVMTSRRVEFDWLYRGLSRFFPEAWKVFRDRVGDDDVIAAYARILERADLDAARAWCAWEDAIFGLEPNPVVHQQSDDEAIAFARICAHYAVHGAWLEEGALIREAAKLAAIPGVIIHGRRDMTCPIETAWELSRAWPNAELVDIVDAGHGRSDGKRAALMNAFERFARLGK